MKINALAKYTSTGISKKGGGKKFILKHLKRLYKEMKSKETFDRGARYAYKLVIKRVK